jgi:hypothetical protein
MSLKAQNNSVKTLYRSTLHENFVMTVINKSGKVHIQPLSIKFRDWVCKKIQKSTY